ncbi:MAG: nucleotidyl transferase AbiEii/AbiGii toxin family protein, partial [Rhodospirillales bacterium]|nr:nucleotidyl transferase AbiEii/AbiGii toxin family protein [Rhodospirillales bacterium]
GGTAINLFVRDLPRMSVDIDLTYLPHETRDTALTNIRMALASIKALIEGAFPDVNVGASGGGESHRLMVRSSECQIKIELSPVLRGTVNQPVWMDVHERVEEIFGYAEMQVVSFDDLFAGKLCAALDRQHPRDLFDVKLLLEHEGLTRSLIQTFIVYLISHPRPIAELLDPHSIDISGIFPMEFGTMARTQVSLDDLIVVQSGLGHKITKSLTEKERQFLMSFKARKPEWSLLGIEGVQELPAVKWKLINLDRMTDDKHEAALRKLETVLRS